MNKDIKELIKYPHKLGNFIGFTKLTDIHTQWIKSYWMNKDDYILQAHRNAYKTTSVIITGYLWYSLLFPDDTVLLIREESTNAENTVITISNLLKTSEMKYLYNQLYGIEDFKLIKDNRNSLVLPTKTKVTIEGSLDCIGIGGSLTGRHYKKVVGDDIVTIKDRLSKAKREERLSKAKREESKNVIRELENIKTADGTLSISGTPWHKDDAFSILPEADSYPLGSIEIPDLTPKKINDIRQRTTSSLFAANYLLKHISSEDRIFPDAKFRAWDKTQTCRAWLDPAYSGKDTTALTLMYFEGKDMVVTGWAWRQDVTELYQKIADICTMYNCGTLFIESNGDHGLSAKDMGKIYPSVRAIHEKENKHNKIISYGKKNWPEIYFSHDCQDDYLNQIIDYEEGQHPDDAPDCLASLIRQIKVDNITIDKQVHIKEISSNYQF
jgi:hypothetical protein